jgi:hypothetical protein
MDEQQVKDAMMKEVAALRSHHLTMSIAQFLVLLLVLVGGGWLFAHTMQGYAAAMAKADTRNEQLVQDMKQMQTDWLQHEKERDAATSQQKVIERVVEKRDADTAKKIVDVTRPDATTEQVAKNFQDAYGFGPILDGPAFSFTAPQVQTVTATKLQEVTCEQDLAAAGTTLTLEKTKTTSLTADLTSSQQKLTEAQGVIKDYQKVAKKTKFQKVLGVGEKLVILAGGILMGRGL